MTDQEAIDLMEEFLDTHKDALHEIAIKAFLEMAITGETTINADRLILNFIKDKQL